MKRTIAISLLLFITLTSFSQTWKRNRIEIFVGLPLTHYFGDIGGTSANKSIMGLNDISYRSVRAGFSFGATYRLNQSLYIQGATTIGFLGSTDAGSRNESRNYGFSTFGTEVTATAMFYIIPESDQNYFYSVMQLRGGLRKMNKPYSLYIFAGAGGLFYKVSPRLDLADSERFDNSQSFTPVIPFGLGIKYQPFSRTLLGLELGARYLLSDKVDGFAPTQSQYNDIYYMVNFKLYYRISYEKFLKRFK
ncbi:MAG: DUF6089 family protein [Bacteroidales bacterium]